jgi:trigger factor
MCEKNARTISVEDRKLQKSDIANIDFEGFVDDAAFEGGKGEKYDLEIGKGAFIEGFEEQLIGMGIGDDREIKVKFPESYHSKNVAGKDATFKVKLHSIKTKELPAIDDEFAKDVSEFDTLKELKADIKSKMESKNKQKAERELEDKLLEKLIENVTVDIPQVMIERQIDNMIRDFDYRLQMQGMRLEHYLEYTNNSYQNFRLGFAESAKKAITISLAVEKVMALEKIESDEEEVKDKIAQIAAEYKKDVAEISKNLKEEDYDYFRDEIKREKTIKFLLDNAKN